MNIRFLIVSVLLCGCTNTKLIPQYIFPDPPPELMVPAQQMIPISVEKNKDASDATSK